MITIDSWEYSWVLGFGCENKLYTRYCFTQDMVLGNIQILYYRMEVL